MARKIRLNKSMIGEMIELKDKDALIIPSNIQYINFSCCNCGAKHNCFIKAKKNRSIILKMHRIE
jgi:hypothetical protein